MRLHIFRLGPQLRRDIKERRYTVWELLQIKEKLAAEVEKRQRSFRRAALLTVGITAALLAMTYGAAGAGGVFWFTCAAVGALVLLALAVSWSACIGFVRYQFDRAVRQAYPGYEAMLCFKDN